MTVDATIEWDITARLIDFGFSPVMQQRIIQKIIVIRSQKEQALRTRNRVPFGDIETIPYELRYPTPTPEMRVAIKERDPICRYCLKRPSTTVDHIYPWSRGGCSEAHNLVGSCQTCNVKKANRTPEEANMTLSVPEVLLELSPDELCNDNCLSALIN